MGQFTPSQASQRVCGVGSEQECGVSLTLTKKTDAGQEHMPERGLFSLRVKQSRMKREEKTLDHIQGPIWFHGFGGGH